MNLDSLISLLADSQLMPNRVLNQGALPDKRFEDLLLAEDDADDRDRRSADSARRYVDNALTAIARSLQNGTINSQPIWQILARPAENDSNDEAAVNRIDAPFDDHDGAERASRGPEAIVVLPSYHAQQQTVANEDAVQGAVTGTFVEFSTSRDNVAEYAYVPVVQSTSDEISSLLKGLLATAAPEGAGRSDSAIGLQDLADTPDASFLAVLSRLGFAAGTGDQGALELTRAMLRASVGPHGRESLFYVPMRGFATGHLDQRHQVASHLFVKLHSNSAVRAGAAAHRASTAGQDAGSASQPGRRAPADVQVARLATMSVQQSRAKNAAVRAAGMHTDYYERLQGVLPPRQNFVVLETGAQKRLFVRDFFAPADTLRRLNAMARDSLFDLSTLNVVINGEDYGRLR